MNDDTRENGSSGSMDKSFSAAVKAVLDAPDNDEAWDHLEELAESLSRYEEVAGAYLDALDEKNPPELRERLAERAVAFHEEWFGGDPDAMKRVLSKVIEIDPESTKINQTLETLVEQISLQTCRGSTKILIQ